MLLSALPAYLHAQDTQAPVMPPPALEAPANMANTPPNLNAAPATPPATPGAAAAPNAPKEPEKTPIPAYTSIFFDAAGLENVEALKELYTLNLNGEAPKPSTVETLFSAEEEAQEYVFPQFYLNSIIYHSDVDWSVWINNTKYTPDSSKEDVDITILEVTGTSVTVQWTPNIREKINMSLPPGDDVTVEKERRLITFKLFPNQTFLSHSFQRVEGHPPVVSVPVSQANKASKIADDMLQQIKDVVNPAPATGPAVPPKNNQGLEGLINMYEKVGEPKP